MLQQTITVLDLRKDGDTLFSLFEPEDQDMSFSDKLAVYVPKAVWQEMGSPKQVTVTINPGEVIR